MTEQKKYTFTIQEALTFAYETLVREWKLYLKVLIVVLPISLLPALLSAAVEETGAVQLKFITVIVSTLAAVLQIFVGMGLIFIALRLHDKKQSQVKDLFASYPQFFSYIIGSILYGLIILGGLLLLIVPGIIWATRFQFFTVAIIEKNMGPIEALKLSYHITAGETLHVLGFQLVLALIGFASAVIILVGPIIAGFFGTLASVYVYRELLVKNQTTHTSKK